MSRRTWTRSAALLSAVLIAGGALATWKWSALRADEAEWASQPEPAELVADALAKARSHQPTTTAIGTVLAMRSITLSNETPGTVSRVALEPGAIVEAGTVLVALDVSVEQAELAAQEAEVALAESVLERVQHLYDNRAASLEELDRARAERDVAVAQADRIRAVIQRKTIRAPFRARVGIADVHPGQYLNAGTPLTTLQGVADAVHVDFAVSQQVAANLREGATVQVIAPNGRAIDAEVTAIDARVDPVTRNAMVRARVDAHDFTPSPGASVRVEVPTGPALAAVTIPVSALRRGPEGDHVFVLAPDAQGQLRAHRRRVDSGTVIGDEVLIHDGLEAGERIAAAGSFKLREAALVAVEDTTAAVAMLDAAAK